MPFSLAGWGNIWFLILFHFILFPRVFSALTNPPVCAILLVVLESWLRETQAWFRSSSIYCWPVSLGGREFLGHLKRLWSRERWPSPKGTVKLLAQSGALPRQKQELDADEPSGRIG